MMTTTRLALLFAGIAALACAPLLLPMVPACAQLGPCTAHAGSAGLWTAATQDAVLLVVGATLLAWVVRISYLGVRTNLLVRNLPAQTWPSRLAAAVGRTVVSRVVCIASDSPGWSS
jgi:hypothetical protein